MPYVGSCPADDGSVRLEGEVTIFAGTNHRIWKQLLDAALAESEPKRLTAALTKAQDAIWVRRRQLSEHTSEAADAERGALDSAARLAKELRRIKAIETV